MSRLPTLILTALLLPGALFAADNPAPQQEPEAVAPEQSDGEQLQEAGEESGAEDNTQDQEEETDARFIPTEEISQDLGVSFPVDI